MIEEWKLQYECEGITKIRTSKIGKELLSTPEPQDASDDKEEFEQPAKPKVNAFALLNDQDESENESDEEISSKPEIKKMKSNLLYF